MSKPRIYRECICHNAPVMLTPSYLETSEPYLCTITGKPLPPSETHFPAHPVVPVAKPKLKQEEEQYDFKSEAGGMD